MNVIIYFIEANIGLILLYLVYRLLLEHETQFSFLRPFLLVGIIGSLLIPLVKITNENLVSGMILLPEITVGFINQMQLKPSTSFDLMETLTLFYFSGIFIFSSQFIFKLIKLIFFLMRSKYTIKNGLKVIEISKGFATFSFFNYVIIGNADSLGSFEKDQIILHESTHLKLLHTLDLFLLEFLKIIFWFNPIVYTLSNKLIAIHEFQADEVSVRNYDSNQYCSLLAKVALMSADIPLANHFSNSLTLKRITMMKTKKTKIKMWKLLAMLPALTLFVLTSTAQDISKTKSKVNAQETPLTTVEQMPEFIGGMDAMFTYLSKELKYPENAVKDKTEGKVFIEFIVEKDGTITDQKVLKGVTAEMNSEALRVVSAFPKWKPGKNKGVDVPVKMVLPINFKL